VATNSSNSSEFMKQLQDPFDPFDIEWRVQSAGKTKAGKLWAIVIPYITNRGIQERLDDVCGIDGWSNEFKETPNGKGILCGISIRFKNGEELEWITKWDGAEETAVEAVKGGLSSAMKRAAVQWGIGRYLYRLEAVIVTPTDIDPKNEDYILAPIKLEGKRVRVWFKRPNMPAWALPGESDEQA
jgi:hypothetical protein